jgi:hypothetical protein
MRFSTAEQLDHSQNDNHTEGVPSKRRPALGQATLDAIHTPPSQRDQWASVSEREISESLEERQPVSKRRTWVSSAVSKLIPSFLKKDAVRRAEIDEKMEKGVRLSAREINFLMKDMAKDRDPIKNQEEENPGTVSDVAAEQKFFEEERRDSDGGPGKGSGSGGDGGEPPKEGPPEEPPKEKKKGWFSKAAPMIAAAGIGVGAGAAGHAYFSKDASMANHLDPQKMAFIANNGDDAATSKTPQMAKNETPPPEQPAPKIHKKKHPSKAAKAAAPKKTVVAAKTAPPVPKSADKIDQGPNRLKEKLGRLGHGLRNIGKSFVAGLDQKSGKAAHAEAEKQIDRQVQAKKTNFAGRLQDAEQEIQSMFAPFHTDENRTLTFDQSAKTRLLSAVGRLRGQLAQAVSPDFLAGLEKEFDTLRDDITNERKKISVQIGQYQVDANSRFAGSLLRDPQVTVTFGQSGTIAVRKTVQTGGGWTTIAEPKPAIGALQEIASRKPAQYRAEPNQWMFIGSDMEVLGKIIEKSRKTPRIIIIDDRK